MALDLVYPRPSVEGAALPFFAEPVAAGFPSPAAGYEAVSYTHLTLPTNREV